MHVLYGGAHLFRRDSAQKLGSVARRTLDLYAPDAASFADALGLDDDGTPNARTHHAAVFERVRAKLDREPIEDLRVDFEDGYGPRPDAEEDEHALTVAFELAAGMAAHTLPPFVGVRIKSLARETAPRALRTLDLVLTALTTRTVGELPEGFAVTLPKVESAAQVETLCDALDLIERTRGLDERAVSIELMVETPRALVDAEGRNALPTLLDAARGRCVALHFGAYDYTAALGVTAAHQSLAHPWCDHARHAMLLATAGRGVRVSDGATTQLPLAPHRAPSNEAERAENRAAVSAAWRRARSDIARARSQGVHQGWDLHPAQLVSRYATVYDLTLRELDGATERLRNFLVSAARATAVGSHFDDAATGQGLVNFFLQAVDAGALTADEVAARVGVSVEALRTRSFAAMVTP